MVTMTEPPVERVPFINAEFQIGNFLVLQLKPVNDIFIQFIAF